MKEVQWNKFHFYSNQLLKTNSSIMNNTIINKKVKEILSILTPRQKRDHILPIHSRNEYGRYLYIDGYKLPICTKPNTTVIKKIKQNHSSFGLYLLLLYLSMKYQ